MPGGGTSGCADPHLRQGGTYFQCNGPVRQSLYRRRSMGGSQGPELRQTMLRFLGWRPSVPRAHYFIQGDYFYPASTSRYIWRDSDKSYPVDSPRAGFKDILNYRKAQGFNMI